MKKASGEVCGSPIRPNCSRRDIVVYILFKGKVLPICSRCWKEIVKMDFEWRADMSEEEFDEAVKRARMILRGKKGSVAARDKKS